MQVLVAGDTHCSRGHCAYLIRQATKFGIDRIFQVGDFGFWPRQGYGRRFLDDLDALCQQAGVTFYWLDGNHEDYIALQELTDSRNTDGEGFHIVRPYVRYARRGHVFEWGNSRCMTMGGAFSVDWQYRTLGESWFLEEMISDSDVAAARAAGKIDTLFCHDAPTWVDLNRHLALQGKPLIRLNEQSERNRKMLNEVVIATDPDRVLHGHIHVRYNETIMLGAKPLMVHGLDCDGTMAKSWTVIEL